ncbi:MAG: Dihydroorotate dehydrogenase B (NAD(+)), electron transfer subunit [Phycisphaerae bacterium]|nr:Dihydroorotate dehydrogenase B (NAD(+)), electron transfer subunit [Phycisphaerae bacterium]
MGSSSARILTADVVSNVVVCREHFRLTLRVAAFSEARPGQFVHLCPAESSPPDYAVWDLQEDEVAWRGGTDAWRERLGEPMLRRAFSIAGLRRVGGLEGLTPDPRTLSPDPRPLSPAPRTPIVAPRTLNADPRSPILDPHDLDVIYRVVGVGTRWMSTLAAGDRVSVLGPLGNAFPIRADKRHAWMIAGGVGLPPMLWLADALQRAGRGTVAFCGARSADLMALTLTGDQRWEGASFRDGRGSAPATDARTAALSAAEFNASGTPVVLATDDGSLGFRGHVGAAMTAYHEANPVAPEELVIYTCGPEVMMRFVAEYALARGIECHVCMERSMACGMGTCQSCVLPVVEPSDAAGWRYSLCCTDGPVYEASRLLWR